MIVYVICSKPLWNACVDIEENSYSCAMNIPNKVYAVCVNQLDR